MPKTYRKTYIVKTGRSWLYKRSVPLDCRQLVGRDAWTQTLGRLSEHEAENEARKLSAAHNDKITHLRRLTEAQRKHVVANGGLEALQASANDWDGYAKRIRSLADALDGVPAAVYADAARHGVSNGAFAQAIVEARSHAKEREAHVAQTQAVLVPASDCLLADLIPVWQRVKAKRSPKVVQKMLLFAQRFVAIVGNLSPADVTRAHVMTFRDAIEKAYSHSNATKHLENIHALFNAAHREGVIATNPAHNVKLRGEAPLDGGKKPFQPAQVRAMFKALKGQSEDFQWMIRLLAYHGARSGELANLHVEDVTTSMGVPVLRIHRVVQGALKNPASKREIPIHPKCRGIIAYAKKAKGPHLFASFPEWQDGRGKAFQKDASAWLRDVVKITDSKLTCHGLRHTWRDLAREVEMPESVSSAIMGHTRGKGEHAKYGAGVSLRLRAKWIAKIDPLA